MYGIHEINNYLRQIDAYLRAQQAQLQKTKNETKELQDQVNALQKQIKEMREKPTTNIEKIEYKFDQLKIETLEGTLNIGLAPNGMTDPETFENFAVNQTPPETLPNLQKYSEIYPRIQDEINLFIKQECPEIITNSANKNQLRLDESYRTFIIQDIKRQLDDRIKYYLNETYNQHSRTDNNNQEEIQDIVISKIKNDIVNAINTFIIHLPKGGNLTGWILPLLIEVFQ